MSKIKRALKNHTICLKTSLNNFLVLDLKRLPSILGGRPFVIINASKIYCYYDVCTHLFVYVYFLAFDIIIKANQIYIMYRRKMKLWEILKTKRVTH